ncbi:polyribonucleotide nucleotidyltransferase [candidate division WWE3 bacterium RIFCSPLOWO2_12_FULL_36_10]|uniref:Polyribonucleotide nucleotidyltransferase n=1 Tax=candidate division WWE3 bacterium RIFCSPLOWO2_12_FULL_36_10 TaxID=1802630 RepID=A0A1F4VKS1_UNCKA|nr:MAG: polyribonucleotide nucleotidyltransferase [candidate division WWE3 bacterium RIFCSPLOWO2_12_FULL_36_10]
MNKKVNVKKETQFAGKKLVFETGQLASMANMSIKVSFGDTVLLATAVSSVPSTEMDFFPLTVVYEEKLYASGTIKSSRFIKRDGRPTDDAIVTRRLIDHAIRPLFPSDYGEEVQVVVTVLSLEPESDPKFLSLLAASAVLHSSDIPFNGPAVTIGVGYKNGEYILCPSTVEEEELDLHMIVSFVSEDKKLLAVEASANILPEEKVLGALEFARDKVDPLLKFVSEFAGEVNKEGNKHVYLSKSISSDLLKDAQHFVKAKIVEMMGQGFDKAKLKETQDNLLEELFAKFEGKYKKSDMARAFQEVEKHALQHQILDEHKRPDGRGIRDVREIKSEVGILPRVHGSGLFSRGVTQVLTVATLGSPSLEQLVQDMYGEKSKRFMHYYNFPPFSVGEVGKFGNPGGREVGHGMLAENALKPVIPDQKDFPYTILLMSETLASSGSSSMAAASCSSLALMDAGVPIKEMVAGVGVGLIVNDDMSKVLIMTDLAYLEDAFGFMDFKMAGTRTGITAIQCDMKLPGIPFDLLPKIFEQSKEGRSHVLDEMEKTISKPREAVSKYAPKTISINIAPEKIGVVIGTGGKTIKDIEAKTGASLAIEEDGTIVISSVSEDGANKAKEMVIGLTKGVEAGEIYDGKVTKIADFGAFVEILPGREGLLHVSELSYDYIKNVEDAIHVGDIVRVKVLEAGMDGKISLSKKAMEQAPEGYVAPVRRGREGGHSKGGYGNGRPPFRKERGRFNQKRY